MPRKLCHLIPIALLFLASCISGAVPTVKWEATPKAIVSAACDPRPDFRDLKINTIAVMDFENSDRRPHQRFVPHPKFNVQSYDVYEYLPGEDGVVASGVIERVLLQSARYSVVERRKLKKLLEEHRLQLSGLIGAEEAAEIGRLSAADAILSGRLVNAYAHFDVRTLGVNGADGFIGTYVAYVMIEMRLVHVESGEIVWQCLLNRNSLNYLDAPIVLSNHEVISRPHVFDELLHGSGSRERIEYVLEQTVREALGNIL